MASNDVKKTLQLINNINQNSNLELKLQSLTKIKSNLTNNESNLKIFKQLCGFKHLCELLKNNANVKVINLVLSILANSAMNDDIRKEIVIEHHVLGDVSAILYNIENPAIHCRAIRLVANVSRTSLYSKYVMRFPFLPRIVTVLTNTSSSDNIITCIRAIKHMWLWDQYRVHNELVNLNAIKNCLDKLTLLSDKAALILSHLSIIQAMLSVNTKGFIAQMSYLHYEWMVNLLRKERGKFDDILIQILLKLSAYSKTHFELAKTSLVDQIISLIWPPLKVSATKTYQLVKILCALCKENLFRQKIIQTQHAVMALLTYLDMDVIEDTKEPMREENESNRTSVTNEMETSRDESMNEDTSFDTEETMSRTSKSSKADKPSSNLTNSIHYYILLCINAYQYDHEGLYRYLKANLIPILMKRLGGQIDKFEYRHGAAVCDQSKYLATRQSLSSGNMSPLSPNYSGNMSPNSSVSPLYMSPNRSPVWKPSTSTAEFDLDDNDDDDDDKSVYSPLIEFSDEETLSNQGDEDSNDMCKQPDTSGSLSLGADIEERLDVHIIRIMLHISYIKYPFEQLAYKHTWSTLVDYLVKVQQDDCCRNVYKILLIICKNRVFLRSLLSDNFILVVHKKLCRMKHGPHCMICSNAMIYGQGIINEISNETNSHYGFEEIMYLYRLQDQRIDTMSTSDTKSDIVPRSADNTNTANSSNTSDDTTKVPTSTDSISCKSSLDKTSNCGINPCVETPSIGHCNTSSLASNNPTTSSSSLQPLNSSEINPSTPFICVPSTSSGTTSENLSNNTTLNPSKTSENLSKPSSLVNPLTSSNTASFSLNPPTSSSNSNSNTFSTNNTSIVNPLISSSNTTTSINPLTSSCNSPSKSLPTNNTSSINPLMSFSKTAASSSSSINPSTPSSNNNTSSSSINTSSVNPLTSSSNTTSSINPLTSVGLVHFMIPYLLKDHPHFARILFGSDAILARILAELAGPNMEEAVSCIEELMSGMLPLRDERRAVRPPCGGKCAPAQVTYEGDLTFLLDDGSTLKANRELLIHKSLYFETMLCGNFKECDQKSNIKLSNISAPCLETLLRLIAHYCTCVLLRIDIGVYLELIVKSDEYLLHELNYNLIELLYTSHAIITATNVHLVYRWSLNYNEFVQACVSNYENFFSKNEHEPRGGAKRMRMEVEEKEDVKRAKTGDDSGRGKNKEEAKERIEDNGLGKNKEETEYGRKKNKEEAKDRIENSGFGKEEEVKERIDNNGLGKNKEEAKDRSDVSGTAVEKSCEENVKNIDGLTRMSLSDNKDSDKASRDRDKAGKDSDKVCKDSDKARGSNNATGINNATTTNKDSEKVVKKSPENAPLASDQPSCSYHLENVERMEIDEIDMKETLGNSEIDKVKHDKPEDIREKLDKVEKGMETGENIGNKAEVKKYVERLEGNVPDKIKVSENVEIFENVSDNTKVSKHVERLENVPGKERISECEELLKNNVLEKEEIGEDVDMPEEKAGNEMKLSKDEELLERNDEELLEGNQSKDRDLLENIPDKEEINEEVELLDESGVDDAQPCLISDLINEINKNKNALGKSPGTPMAVNVQNNIEQGKDEIKNILLLKNEPSFKLRKLPLAAKKHRLPTTHSSTSSRREDLNVFLIKLIFSQSGRSSVRKSVEVVRNIIGMSQEGDEDIFEQFKYDIHEFIRENLK